MAMVTQPRRHRPFLAFVAALLGGSALLAGCGSGSGSAAVASDAPTAAAAAAASAPGPTAGPVGAPVAAGACPPGWRCNPCPPEVPAGWQCGLFAVALVEGGTETIDLEVRRRPATVAPSLGPLFINLGGPGDPSADSAVPIVAALPANVRDRFDVVLMDPRSTLHSSATACPTAKPGIEGAYYSLPDPASTSVQPFIDRMAAANAACLAEIGTDPTPYGTWAAAADMDAVRASLNADKMTYLGYSYGTRLGAVYAERFGDRVRAMVLDSSVNPTGGLAEFAAGKARAVDTIIQRWAQQCDAQPTCAPTGGALAAVDAATAKLPLTDSGNGLTWTRGDFEQFLDAAASSLDPAKWAALGPALSAFAAGNTRAFYTLVAGQAPPGTSSGSVPRPAGTPGDIQDALVTVNCADLSDRPDAAAVSSIVTAARTAGLRAANARSYLAATCAGWPVGNRPITSISAAPAARVVVVTSLGDQLVAADWGPAMSRAVGGVTVNYGGVGHGVSFLRGSTCIDSLVSAYLVDPARVPADGTGCDGA